TLDDYEVISGAWQFSDRRLSSGSGADNRILLDCRPKDFSLSVWLKNADAASGGTAKVLFRVQNSTDYYALVVTRLDATHVSFGLYNGAVTLLVSGSATGVLADGLAVQVSAQGAELNASINGVSVSVIDASFEEGQIGFGSDDAAEFNDLAAIPVP
ncbi:MAG: hypothetical protein V1708_03825, partial [Candidatus Micrarchaeota archaeon]